MKFFTPITSNPEEEERLWQHFNNLSNPINPNKYKKRVFSVKEMNSKLERVSYDKIDGNFPDSTIPLCFIIETDTTFDLYGIKLEIINNEEKYRDCVHKIRKTNRVIPEYFDD